jgi:predicted amidohydrolase
MAKTLNIGCLQYSAGADTDRNLRQVEKLLSDAVGAGAQLVCLPEYATCYGTRRGRLVLGAEDEEEHTGLLALKNMARERAIWMLIGSVAIKSDDGMISNRSYLIDDAGSIVARYDKLHLFDVDLEGGESYRESDLVRPGEQAVLIETPLGRLGLTICYDIRFPQLYRTLAKAGADILFVPAAFTRKTGQAHWHTLVTARAIETGAYLVAPCQCGEQKGKLKRYGHSLIVDPWGGTLADGGENTGVITAEIDLDKVEVARRSVPALQHDRLFEISVLSREGAGNEKSKRSPTSS